MDPVLGSVVAGTGGTIGSAIINAFSQHITNAQNRKMAEEAYNKQMAAIREQNIYNSPAMQSARLMEAGLNPSLAYGANGELVGQQTDIPEYNPIPAEAPSIGDLGQGFERAVSAGLAIRDQENKNLLALSTMALQNSEAFKAYTESEMTADKRRFLLDTWDIQVDNMRSEGALNWQSLVESRQRIAESKSRINLNDKTIQQLSAETNLTNAQVIEILTLLPARVRNMDADTALKWMQTAEGKQTIELLAAQTMMTSHEDARAWTRLDYEGDRIKLEGRDISVKEASLDLEKDWQRFQKRYMTATFAEQTVMDVGKTIIGFCGMSKLGGIGSLAPLGPRTGTYGNEVRWPPRQKVHPTVKPPRAPVSGSYGSRGRSKH